MVRKRNGIWHGRRATLRSMNAGLIVLGLAALGVGLWIGARARRALEAEGDLSPSGRVYKRARRWALSKLLRGGDGGSSDDSRD